MINIMSSLVGRPRYRAVVSVTILFAAYALFGLINSSTATATSLSAPALVSPSDGHKSSRVNPVFRWTWAGEDPCCSLRNPGFYVVSLWGAPHGKSAALATRSTASLTPSLKWRGTIAPGTYWWSVAPDQYATEAVSLRRKVVLGSALDLGGVQRDARHGRFLLRAYTNSAARVKLVDDPQHGKTQRRVLPLKFSGAYSDTRTRLIAFPWDCARTGRHYIRLSVTSGRKTTTRTAKFTSPSCSHRFTATASADGTIYPNSAVSFGIRDHWKLGAGYRVCVQGPGVRKCWNRRTSKSKGFDKFDVHPTAVGNYKVTWSVGGKLYQRRGFTVRRRPPPPPLYLDGSEALDFASTYTEAQVTGSTTVVSQWCNRWSGVEIHCGIWVDGYEWDEFGDYSVVDSCVTTVYMVKRSWGIQASDDGCSR